MYIAGRTRTASRPSRTRMAPASYSDSASTVLMSSVMSPGEPSLCRPHATGLHLEHADRAVEPRDPVPMGRGDQGLAALGHAAAQGEQAFLVQLRVQVVQQGHGALPALLAVHLDRGQRQREEEAPRLPR